MNITRRTGRRIAWGMGLIVVVDLATKLVAAALASGRTTGAFTPLRNHDFSLGLAGAPPAITIVIAALGIAVAATVTLRPALRGELPAWIPVCLLGGATANLIDRVAFGSVHDFIATPWIVFNLADVAVVAALVGLALHHRHNHLHHQTDELRTGVNDMEISTGVKGGPPIRR